MPDKRKTKPADPPVEQAEQPVEEAAPGRPANGIVERTETVTERYAE